MLDRPSAQSGAFAPLLSEALPAVASSAQIFANAPAGTVGVLLTVRGGTLTINWGQAGAAAPTATATNGIDYAPGSYPIEANETTLERARAIGSAVSSGWITYLGIA